MNLSRIQKHGLQGIKMGLKELKSIDVASYTTILAGISLLISVILSVIITGIFAVSVPGSIGIIAYIIPTIVFGTLIWSIFILFSQATLYNALSKIIGAIKLDINGNYIKSISSKETTILVTAITMILNVVIYLSVSFLMPMILSTILSILMYSGQNEIGMAVYQLIVTVSNPMTIILGLVFILIATLILTLLSTYIYNFLGDSERGITVELSNDGKFTVVESVDAVSFAVAISAISLIVNIVLGVIMIVNGTPLLYTTVNILSGFIGTFVACILVALFYNYLSPRIGKLKVELEQV